MNFGTMDGTVGRVARVQRQVGTVASCLTALIGAIALLVSVAGTYSVLAFTVARRTREIGIRVALGADPRRIVTGIFSRVQLQMGLGIVFGAGVWFYIVLWYFGGQDRTWRFPVVAIALLLLGAVACGVPVRRALRIEPTEALREA